jgi:methylated-DNA-protein-cysteine methyltransferase-like protein
MTARQPTFAEQVYAIVAQIPAGRVTTYGWIARALGAPRSARPTRQPTAWSY